MTDTNLLAAFHQAFGTAWTLPRDTSPAAFEDGETLRRSFGGLSKSARREQRRPRAFVRDELDYTPTGAWVPTSGGGRDV